MDERSHQWTGDSRLPIFDGHNDVLLNLFLPERGAERNFWERSERGHIDLPRARAGGLGGGLFAVYVPADPSVHGPTEADIMFTDDGYEVPLALPLQHSYAQPTALAMIALLFRLEAASEGQLRVVRSAGELEQCLAEGVLAAVLHMEGAEAIDADLNALEVLYRAGLRSLGIVWSRPNIFGHGVPFRFPASPDTGPGLTEAGRRLVRACNELGILLDLSHLNEQGFWDVAALSDAPLVASHSNVHALCPTSRNLTDRQLDAIGESDGLVGLNFAVTFLRADGHKNPDTDLDVMVRHVDYLVERLGIDRVGFGSDFDGATVPQAIGDVAGLPRLLGALRRHGYDDGALRKLAYENWLRVLRRTWGA